MRESQKALMAWVAFGIPVGVIAKEMGISKKTVWYHLQPIRKCFSGPLKGPEPLRNAAMALGLIPCISTAVNPPYTRLCDCRQMTVVRGVKMCRVCRLKVSAEKKRRLTDRQAAILAFYAWGLSPKQIANEMGRGERSMEWSMSEIRRRLGSSSPQELTRYAIAHGLIPNFWPQAVAPAAVKP